VEPSIFLKSRNTRRVQISKSSERVHCYMESGPDRGGLRDRPISQRPPFPARGHSASDCDGGPLCPRALYARRDTRILLRNVCPCAVGARVFVSSVLLLFRFFFPVLPFLSLSFSPPVSPRSRGLALAPRRSMADAAGCLASLPPSSLPLSLCLRASAVRVKVPLV